MKELLALPWQIQIVVIGGYFAYVIAYSGKRSAHKSVDTFAIILCFGGISILSFDSLDDLIPDPMVLRDTDISYLRRFVLAGGAIAGALVSALLWRRFLERFVKNILRKISKSDDDGMYKCWDSLIQEPNLYYEQLSVTLKSGNVLESYPLKRFDGLPNGNCILGGDGSIAMYVTHITNAKGRRREAKNLECEDEGARITYIPADEISEVDFRRKRKQQKEVTKKSTCFRRFFHLSSLW